MKEKRSHARREKVSVRRGENEAEEGSRNEPSEASTPAEVRQMARKGKRVGVAKERGGLKETCRVEGREEEGRKECRTHEFPSTSIKYLYLFISSAP